MADENEEEVFNLFSEQKAELLDGCSTNWELGFGGQYRVTASCPFLEKWMKKVIIIDTALSIENKKTKIGRLYT